MRTKHRRDLQPLVQAAGIMTVALLLVINAGCGSTKVSTQNNAKPSVGQELTDLQKAHEQGLINDNEYSKLKDAVVKKNE